MCSSPNILLLCRGLRTSISSIIEPIKMPHINYPSLRSASVGLSVAQPRKHKKRAVYITLSSSVRYSEYRFQVGPARFTIQWIENWFKITISAVFRWIVNSKLVHSISKRIDSWIENRLTIPIFKWILNWQFAKISESCRPYYLLCDETHFTFTHV